jgi:hypothetical protein
MMARARRQNGLFDFGTRTYSARLRRTYSDDKERRAEIKRKAAEEKRDAAERKRAALEAQREQRARDREEERQLKADERAERKARLERKKADAQDRKIEREMREKGYRNPAWGYGVYVGHGFGETQVGHFKSKAAAETWARGRYDKYTVKRAFAKNPAQSGAQYRLAQAVLAGTARSKTMTKKVAQEIIDRTPKKLRSLFSESNPVDAAAELSEAWHGRPAETETDYNETVRYHSVLTDLGQLSEIKVYVTDRHVKTINFDDETRLCSSENGKQLYVVGGDQSLDLAALGIEGEAAEKDSVEVGRCYSITYITAKMHLGKADRQTGPYEHTLGEDGGELPILLYDTLNKQVSFAGGSYFIDPTDYDGAHSAGIRD